MLSSQEWMESSISSKIAESALITDDVNDDEFKWSLIGVRGGVAEHKAGAGPIMEMLEAFLEMITPILAD